MRPVVRLSTTALLLLLATACSSIGVVSAWLNGEVAFSPAQLQRSLDNRFPRSFDKLGGLVSVTMRNPRLSIPRGDRRLRLDFDLDLGTTTGRASSGGHVALASGLRYEPSTQGLHLADPELLHFELPESGMLLRGGARTLVNNLLAEYARTEPVHRLDPSLLSKLPPGRRIDAVEIERGLVVVHLDN